MAAIWLSGAMASGAAGTWLVFSSHFPSIFRHSDHAICFLSLALIRHAATDHTGYDRQAPQSGLIQTSPGVAPTHLSPDKGKLLLLALLVLYLDYEHSTQRNTGEEGQVRVFVQSAIAAYAFCHYLRFPAMWS